jgi:uncharacterized protein (TIGR02996 family)
MPDPHPDELAFLAKIADHPDYPLPRLVFADWLEERGDRRAAWVRDDAIWEWMKPDAHDPIPGILAALRVREMFRTDFTGRESEDKARAAIAKLEPSAVEAVRAWLQAHPDHWPTSEVQKFVGAHPPAKLRTVKTLRTKLKGTSWVDVWLAVVDLGFHGPNAAPAITDLTKINGWDRWIVMLDGLQEFDYPVENAIMRTFVRIGPAAKVAVPWIASKMWMYPTSAEEALIRLGADADLVIDHLNDDDSHEVEDAFEVVMQLTDDPVPVLVRAAQRHTHRKAREAISRLARLGPKATAAIPALIELRQNRTGWDAESIQSYATHALAQIRGEVPPT